MKTITITILIVFSLVACQKNQAPSDSTKNFKSFEDERHNKSFPPHKEDRVLKLTLIENEKPNQFSVALDWKEATSESEEWVIEREEGAETKQIAKVNEAVRHFIDDNVEPNHIYRYSLARVVKDSPTVITTNSIRIPLDLEISSEVSLEQVTGYHRLFLRKSAILKPKLETLKVEVEKIISEEGIIGGQNPLSDVSSSKGKSGANLVVKAKEAKGFLTLNTSGGEGKVGGQGPKGPTGSQGAQGKTAEIMLAEKSYMCISPPGNGGPGNQGGKGGSGLTGGPGGNAGSIFVDIVSAKHLNLSLEMLPGVGGQGGPGGPGGDGGPGGAAGDNPKQRCPFAKPGPVGPVGTIGDKGPIGVLGQTAPYCLQLNGTSSGNCSAFKK